MDNFSVLPEGCISQILSMTSPRDACRASAISSGFDAAANSDSSFALDRESGKKCYTLSAREVAIAWKEDSRYWKWISLPESRPRINSP
ncbi:hypothetical protein RHMOL_Rhmol09G0065200 [Rhododendron molle]|uniref:Uncharacterized protein n=1 Tax=Rhododendron molle TaxID=49168 RepID=A0ACC0MAB0_RHOML|nr:hypothetical protein RHMOL_Rhmol09G0065200 [Rhododendron molle]